VKTPNVDNLEDFYEDAPVGLVTTRPDGAISRVNRTFTALVGRRAEELVGARWTGLLSPPSVLLFETYCVPLLRLRGSVGEVALDIVGHGGKPVPVLLAARARPDGGGLQLAVLSAPTRREYERELKEARAHAEAANSEIRAHRELAERKLAEHHALLEAVGRLAAGDRDTPITAPAGGSSAELVVGLEQMRRDIQRHFHALLERNAEVVQLNAELRHQIEQRSLQMIETMEAGRSIAASSGTHLRLIDEQPIMAAGSLLAQRYRVLSVLGQGAMGVVYEVERVSDGRHLAAKVLSTRPDFHALVRFAREARLLARLRHPNLLVIVDVDVTVSRVAFIVMELARGRSLAEYRDRYGDVRLMLPILCQVADALIAVHAADVVHRDIKPSNVLVRADAGGQAHAKLLDFGVSRLLEGRRGSGEPPERAVDPGEAADSHRALISEVQGFVDAPTVSPWPEPEASPPVAGGAQGAGELTQIGAILGTPRYMAPEMLLGARSAMPPADIFSFGVMAYEVLTGILPFTEPPPLLAARSVGDLAFVPLATRRPDLPPALAHIVDSCLSADPALRPEAAALLAVFSASLAHERRP
jgi:PAS domain S-box-containing protein